MKKTLVFLTASACLFTMAGVVLADYQIQSPIMLGGSLGDLIDKFANGITDTIGVLAVLMFLIAGVLFIISGGNQQKIATAKNCALYAAIGLGIALAGQGIIAVVKSSMSG